VFTLIRPTKPDCKARLFFFLIWRDQPPQRGPLLRYLVPILLLLSLAIACGGSDSRPVVSIGEIGDSGEFELTTVAFAPGGRIPARYTSGAYAAVLDDPDAPGGTFKHGIIFDIDPSETGLIEGIEKTEVIVGGAVQPNNDFSRTGYGGPCPPEGTQHRYQLFVYALSERLNLRSTDSQTTDCCRALSLL
jgi:Raf kinase inhibitor-like YbhB/YbcL family protein